jgi:hypothetical protein
MRERVTFFPWITVFLPCALFLVAGLQARPPGQIKTMYERADTAIKQKNRFVTKLLREHGISRETDSDGMIPRINAPGDWLPVRRMDIVPVPKEGGEGDEVAGHEVLIYTDGETVRLFCDSRVR